MSFIKGSLDKTLDENEVKLTEVTSQHADEIAALQDQHAQQLETTSQGYQKQILVMDCM